MNTNTNDTPAPLDLNDNSLVEFKLIEQAIHLKKELVNQKICDYLNYANPEALKEDLKGHLLNESHFQSHEVQSDDPQVIKFELKSSSGSIRNDKGVEAAKACLEFLKERREEKERQDKEAEDLKKG
jgi:hypothetical protein